LVAANQVKMKKSIYFGSLFFLMLITGVFWGTWFTLTRSIENFSPAEFTHIGKVIIANVAVPMRIIMPSGILLVALSLWLSRQKRTTGFYAGVLSLILLIATLLITVLILVPIDNALKEWATTIPPDFEQIRHKWKTYHAIRTFLSLASFACFSLFILSNRNKEQAME
jgi:uncharacterized membrane protein